jgi:hypothetical protein
LGRKKPGGSWLGEVPLGLLDLAVRRVIRENVYHVVPLPGVVWAAVQRELGDPWDVRLAMEVWVETKYQTLMCLMRSK